MAGTISITATGVAYVETFDTLATTGPASALPNGIYFVETGTAANATYGAGTGSSTTGDTYSFGLAGVNTLADRAFGALQSGSVASTLGAFFTNATGAAIGSLAVSYAGEQWRLGTAGRVDRLDFQYSLDATSLTTGTWIDVDALDFTAPVTAGTLGALDGNASANRTAVSGALSSLSLANGSTIWFRWVDLNATGADDGLAIDDLSVTATGAVVAGSVSVDSCSVTEGDSGTKTLTFTVTRTGGTADFAVNFATADDTATAGSDYVSNSGLLNFTGGATTQTVSVTVNGDTTLESDERFFLNLSGATNGATIGTAQGVGTITNDDTNGASTTVSVNSVSVAEGDSGTTSLTFTVTRSDNTGGFDVMYTSADGTATTVSGDYVSVAGTLTFVPGGALTQTVTVTVNGDLAVEADETFTLTLSNPNGYTGPTPVIGTATGTGTILNDDVPTAGITVGNVSVTEGDSGTKTLTFTVTRSDTSGAFTLDYATADGTATAGSDYAATSGTLTFTAGGAATQTVGVTINGDTTVEPDETLRLNLSNLLVQSGRANLTTTQATGTITNDDATITPIYTIQGAGHLSPLAGQTVTTTGVVTGVVTTGSARGYYIQDPTGDGDLNTSDAVLVFTGTTTPTVSVGNSVRVTGTVTEFRSAGALSLTEITNATATVVTASVPLPDAVVLGDGAGRRAPPTVLLGDNDVTGVFNPTTQATDFYETLEGMRVTVLDTSSVSAYKNSNGEIWVRSSAIGTNSLNSRGSLTISDTTPGTAQPANKVFDFNPERIKLNDTIASLPTISGAGDKLGDVTGILSYNFGSYELLNSAPVTVVQTSTLAKETTTIAASNDTLRVASFNVRNLAPVGFQDGEGATGHTVTQAEMSGRARAIVTNLGAPDIVALQELQDNNGITNDGTVDGSTTLQQLIDAIVAVGGPRYKGIDSNPANGQDGGVPGGNIRPAYLYNPATVTPTAANNLTQDAQADVFEFNTANRIGVNNADFSATRKSLPIEWAAVGFSASQGGTFYTIDNHFSSKGGSTTLTGGDLGNPLYGEPVNSDAVKREGQAIAVKAFIDGVLNDGVTTNDRIVALGDFNDFQFFPVVQLATGAVTRATVGTGNTDSTFTPATSALTSLAELLSVNERYSYNFEGNAQELDQVLVSNGLLSTTSYDIVHINSEFADQISDHDPSVASLSFPRYTAIATAGDDVLDQAAFTARFGAVRGSLAGADVIYAGGGADRVESGDGDDMVFGEAGDDVLVGGGGADRLTGGSGADTFRYAAVAESTPSAQDYLTDFASGSDRIQLDGALGAGGAVAVGRSGSISTVFFARADGVGGTGQIGVNGVVQATDFVVAANTTFYITGDAGSDVIYGSNGVDYINGGDGADNILGNRGADQLTGGAGGDIFYYYSIAESTPGAQDYVTDFASGSDRIYLDAALGAGGAVAIGRSGSASTVYFARADGVGGTGQIGVNGVVQATDFIVAANTTFYITGDAGSDVIYGSAGVDYINGGGGADNILGGGGGDQLTGGAGGDIFYYYNIADSTPGAQDYLTDFASGSDKIYLDAALGAGGAVAISRSGSTSTVYFARAEGVGGTGQIGVNGTVQGNDFIVAANTTFYITGDAGSDVIYGSNGVDYINGGGGADNILGGLGADQITGGVGGDIFYYYSIADSTAAARDTITDFATGQDKINIQQLGAGALNIAFDGTSTVVTFTATGGGAALSVLAVGQVRFGDLQVAAGVTLSGNGAPTGDASAEYSPLLVGQNADAASYGFGLV